MIEPLSKRCYVGYVVILTLLCGNPVWADDIGIFFNRMFFLSWASTPDSYTGGTVVRDPSCNINAPDGNYCASEHITGSPTYISPFTSECQSNHIMLLTDGEPTFDSLAASEVMALTGGECEAQPIGKGTCGEEIASYLYTFDQHTDSGEQTITTHTIGFNFTTQWLRDVASAGGAGLPPPPQTLILQTTDDDSDQNPGDAQIVTVAGGNTLLTHERRTLIERVYWSEYPHF